MPSASELRAAAMNNWPVWFSLMFALELLLNRLHLDIGVGVDANLAGDLQGRFDDFFGGQLRMLQKRLGRRGRISAAGADADDAVAGLDHVAGAADNQARRL